jgi:hypothetical protein
MNPNTDKELLELAAKAARYELIWGVPFPDGVAYPYVKNCGWNPLTDDGDALRLAVKLQLLDNHDVMYGQWDGENPYEAQRRAIVIAAAEIGKTL